MTSVNIFDIIICKLKYLIKFNLIFLFKVKKNLEINLYDIILFFYLNINLRIKNG